MTHYLFSLVPQTRDNMPVPGPGRYKRKKVAPATAVKEPGVHTALLESAVRNCRDKDRCVPVFP